jgi:hypothetical protein
MRPATHEEIVTNSLIIRPVMREDFPQWLPLREGYNAFYGCAGATALPDAVTQAKWGRFFDIYEPMHALVAEEGETFAGLGALPLSPLDDHRGGQVAICMIFSLPRRHAARAWGEP